MPTSVNYQLTAAGVWSRPTTTRYASGGYEEIMDAVADPLHPDHNEHSAWVADITGSNTPFEPAFLDISAVNRVLADQF